MGIRVEIRGTTEVELKDITVILAQARSPRNNDARRSSELALCSILAIGEWVRPEARLYRNSVVRYSPSLLSAPTGVMDCLKGRGSSSIASKRVNEGKKDGEGAQGDCANGIHGCVDIDKPHAEYVKGRGCSFAT